jgi:DNA helicase-2/ATP-dependent DNA helicase PcrA
VQLNSSQQLAVNTIEGPVMVIAGAGTGKTQVIAHRIANILKSTQTPPSSILCLTFTDNAAFNMRTRLISLVGPTAYSVKIHTFHSFCNEVIQAHPEYFIFGTEAKVVDQLEQIEIFRSIIDQLPDGAVLKPWGDKYFYLREVGSRLQNLKRESISPDTFNSLIESEKYFVSQTADIFAKIKLLRVGKALESDLLNLVQNLLKTPNISEAITSLVTYHLTLFNNGGYDIGAAKNPAINFKNALLHFVDGYQKNIPKQEELLTLYTSYQQSLKARGRYDFDDMILFVLHAFKANPDLLLEYQEKIQYILVDEYQDTNSSQNQIVDLLGSYFDNPNIFVVGDDDQSIFRFQGASLENLQTFLTKYQVDPIVLTNNYRSHQLILDTAASVINHNQNRLGNLIKTIDKNLVSSTTADQNPVNLTIADSPLSENFLVGTKIKELLDSGVKANEIAVIYRNNRDVNDLLEILTQLKVPFYLPSEQNILESKPIIHLIYLLKLIQSPQDQTLLYPVLASEFVNFDPLDLLHLSRGEPISKKSQKVLKKFNLRLARARVRLQRYNLDKFFNITIRKFKFLKYCLLEKNISVLNQLHTFYKELKRLCLEEKFTLEQFLRRLDLYTENQVPLSCPPLISDTSSSVALMTAHRAKGLEFGHVFIIQAVDKKWGNNPDRSTIKLPTGIINTELSTELNDVNEEERRLFYVALTRAKSQIYISYASKSNSLRDQLPSIFLSEIDPKLIELIPVPSSAQSQSLQTLFSASSPSFVNTASLKKYLTEYFASEYVFNVTHLNSYLRCPFCFYHTTILRLPQAKNKFSSFGTAIHAALSVAYSGRKNIIETFDRVLQNEQLPQADFQESLKKGHEVLSEYIKNYPIDTTITRISEHNFRSSHVHFDNIPITGKIDLVNVINKNQVEVVDFKTGNPDGKYKELSVDGDYFRQLVFYKLLASLDPNFNYEVVKGTIDFVEKSKQKGTFVRKEFAITEEHLQGLRVLIKDTYQKIISLEFNIIGENCRNPNHLHHLFKNK